MITITNLTKKYGERIVLDDISLNIGEEIFGLLGPNGAGKTTIVNILCGLLKRDSGEILVAGLDPIKNPGAVRKKIGLVAQETALYEYLTAKENLVFHARFYGVPRSEREKRIQEALELAQLEDRANEKVSKFSGGMKRRLALTRSLIHDPEILILDEPSLGIDVQNRNEIWNRIHELKEEQSKCILLTTNYMDEADRLSDRCAIIDNGKIITLDEPEKLKIKHAGGTRLEAIVQASRSDLNKLKKSLQEISPQAVLSKEKISSNNIIVMPAKEKANVLLRDVSELFQKYQNVKLIDLSLRVPTLDDVFLELTGSKLRD